MGRESTFSHPEIVELLSTRFIPFADDCHPYQVRQDGWGEYFRHIAEQGHYAGREHPTNTRQGHYAFTFDGRFLGSINTNDPTRLLEVLYEALERFEKGEGGPAFAAEIPSAQSSDARSTGAQSTSAPTSGGNVARYPKGGMVLKVFVRDLAPDGRPRAALSDHRFANAWNMDFAWFTSDEINSIFEVPLRGELRAGTTMDLPEWFGRRLARFHFVDTVRGQSPHWPSEAVKRAAFNIHVTDVSDHRVRLLLTGDVLCEEEGVWSLKGSEGAQADQKRGMQLQAMGEIVWDAHECRIDQFDAAAVGHRWGGTMYNVRWAELEPAPIGFWIELAGDTPAETTPPAAFWAGYYRH